MKDITYNAVLELNKTGLYMHGLEWMLDPALHNIKEQIKPDLVLELAKHLDEKCLYQIIVTIKKLD